jgi:Adenylate and Guanylate cyclase catalytic domain
MHAEGGDLGKQYQQIEHLGLILAEALETTCIHSVAGLTGDRTALVTTRPCWAPHPTISDPPQMPQAYTSDLHLDYTVVGQTTHLAARMEQMAMSGSILIIPEVFRLAEGHIQVKSLGPLPIKGLTAPVAVYEVTGAGHVRTQLQAAAAGGLTGFVGRNAEIHTLHQALQQAGAGHGQVVAAQPWLTLRPKTPRLSRLALNSAFVMRWPQSTPSARSIGSMG